jgi:hypothetical protein
MRKHLFERDIRLITFFPLSNIVAIVEESVKVPEATSFITKEEFQ